MFFFGFNFQILQFTKNITRNKNITKPNKAENETNILKEKRNSVNNKNDPKQLLNHKITRIEPIKKMNNNEEEHKNKEKVITKRYTDRKHEVHAPSKEKEIHRQENSKVITEKPLQESKNKNCTHKLDKSKHNSTKAESKEDEDEEQKAASNTWSNSIKATAIALTTLVLLYLDWPETQMESRS